MYTVVVADDEIELRNAMVRMIKWEEIGFEVIGEAENGIEALELVERLEPDLLLTDIKMPFLSGIDLARRAREIRPAMNIAFLSGYDDFSYAQQAIQYNIISYLLKPISAAELTGELISIREKMDEKVKQLKSLQDMMDEKEREKEYQTEAFLLSVFLDGNRAKENPKMLAYLDTRAVELGIRKSEAETICYMTLVTEFSDEQGNNSVRPEHVGFLDTILKKYVYSGSAYSNGKIISLVSSTERDLKKYAAIFAKEIIQNAKRIWNVDCIVGVSKEFEHLSEGNEAYLEALAACDYSQGEKNEPFFISDMEKVGTYSSEYISDITSELERLLKTGEQEVLQEFLQNTMHNDRKKNSNFLLLQIMSTIYASACSVAEEENVEQILKGLSFPEKLFLHYAHEDIEGEIVRFALEARDMIGRQRRMNSEVICEEGLRIIQEEYRDEDLSLASLSERLHVSSSYLSSLFKKIQGDTFVNILTQKRMEVAKEYLLCSSKKILEIANECGYSDHHYFSYCYKKYYGISPNKMRESVRNV